MPKTVEGKLVAEEAQKAQTEPADKTVRAH